LLISRLTPTDSLVVVHSFVSHSTPVFGHLLTLALTVVTNSVIRNTQIFDYSWLCSLGGTLFEQLDENRTLAELNYKREDKYREIKRHLRP